MAELHLIQGSKHTFIASVLFAEIAGYDDRPVFEQIQFTTRMRQLLEHVAAKSGARDMLVVDREDSVILLFHGDPSDCFALAKQLSEILSGDQTHHDLPLHIGINLGPVTLSKNELSVPHVSGAGVEDAMRVAHAGLLREVLISRAYYTVLARISTEYSALEYREFISDELDESFAIYGIAGRRAPPAPSLDQTVAPARTWRWRYATASVLVAAGAIAIYRDEPPDTVRTVKEPQVALSKAIEQPKVQRVNSTADIVAGITFHHALRASAPSAAIASPTALAKRSTHGPVIKPAKVRLAIKPWGEVYVDGKKVGVTPPLHNINITPGKRQIVVRNADFLPYRATFDIEPESLLQISHSFDK